MNTSSASSVRVTWNYSPAMQLYMRMLVTAYLDTRGRRLDGSPSDDALLAREWIATGGSRTDPTSTKHVTFDQCCQALGIDPDVERVPLLSVIDDCNGFDTDEAWSRLAELRRRPIADDHAAIVALPRYARVVPVVDQVSIFSLLSGSRMAVGAAVCRPRVLPHPVALRVTRHRKPGLETGSRINVSASAHADRD